MKEMGLETCRGDDRDRNTKETAHALRKLPLVKAKRYLEDVLAHKQAIPFTRFSVEVLEELLRQRTGTLMGRVVGL
ncbi:60S ribosomal protein L17-2 [Striga hermonthica]|uniref:60S ribosomal protein L17-2 n=1 Tax=Striga hermonthica TaxID=68872 RepID=A0A9N7MZ91_STRHE|nr:60S ribosomal protein L17-2 [Striga hermonthica]